ncbi:BgTH12-02262 [Blumeria graminis f. sp. triticale]|uniref:BgtAc-30797 n=3 Tax=Blumeria graminis TaxID=34373 RepID=A0A9X9MH64_BLUGR|nr:hypothetical protein BGT96224_Ac30797 [Blumeria graminis f. sp. tritici 96224]CAD6502019.1 BgTH12-02262 [Blumeria graminis f. sp. triticale]VDB85979.1 BgtAc-30797 [Blumeria graminis f. sp. tritici]
MAYQSQINEIKRKLQREGSSRWQNSSQPMFRQICNAFYQAEDCPHSIALSRSMKQYLAEENIWAYLFGKDSRFPGIKPSNTYAHYIPSQAMVSNASHANTRYESELMPGRNISKPNSSSPALECVEESKTTRFVDRGAAKSMRRQLEEIWALGKNKPANYEPQFGWNPSTGEPWLALRSYRENSYTSLSGPAHRYLRQLSAFFPAITIQYDRFPHLGFTLIWFDLRDPKSVFSANVWRELAQLRAFFEDWASSNNVSRPIHQAYKIFIDQNAPTRPTLPLPDDFDPDVDAIFGMAPPRCSSPSRSRIYTSNPSGASHRAILAKHRVDFNNEPSRRDSHGKHRQERVRTDFLR